MKSLDLNQLVDFKTFTVPDDSITTVTFSVAEYVLVLLQQQYYFDWLEAGNFCMLVYTFHQDTGRIKDIRTLGPVLNLTSCLVINNSLLAEYPSALHTTAASLLSQKSSHTVPHLPPTHTSTLPSSEVCPSTSCKLPWTHSGFRTAERIPYHGAKYL